MPKLLYRRRIWIQLSVRRSSQFNPIFFRLLFIVLEVSQAGQFAKDPLDQLRNGIFKQK